MLCIERYQGGEENEETRTENKGDRRGTIER